MSATVHIVKTPDVLHGKPRLEGTRIGVYELGGYVTENDVSIEQAADEFNLDDAQVRAAVKYYDDHPELMETIHAQKQATEAAIERRSHTG
ncbi:DUF433 domain-containing protein [Halobacteriales archaeon QH_8_67_36]|nr:MAG: DUF433 domain-containing protein [Halobacteriales archaeon QH_8_67_36]